MLTKLTSSRVRLIAELANAARNARDEVAHGIPQVGEPHPARGEHDRTGMGDFDLLPPGDRSVTALRNEIRLLDPGARSELFALMRIGQGELAAADWERGLSEAARLGDESVNGILADDIDLQSHLSRGLYELRLA
jgi:hypothetical protein